MLPISMTELETCRLILEIAGILLIIIMWNVIDEKDKRLKEAWKSLEGNWHKDQLINKLTEVNKNKNDAIIKAMAVLSSVTEEEVLNGAVTGVVNVDETEEELDDDEDDEDEEYDDEDEDDESLDEDEDEDEDKND